MAMKLEMRRPKNSNNEIEVNKFEIVGEIKTRGMIALTVVSICSGFLVGSAVYGIVQGNFVALETVMAYVQTPIGILIGYYFGKKYE
jgi:hypothetical protein